MNIIFSNASVLSGFEVLDGCRLRKSTGLLSSRLGLYTISRSYGVSRNRHLSILADAGFEPLEIPKSGLWSVLTANVDPYTYIWKCSIPHTTGKHFSLCLRIS